MNRVKIVMIIIIGLVLLSPAFSEENDPNGGKAKKEAKEVSTGQDVRKKELSKEDLIFDVVKLY